MEKRICPRCKAAAFNWSKEQGPDLFTWQCSNCGYKATEDASMARECFHCRIEPASSLDDGDQQYWWCWKCRSISGAVTMHQ